LELINNIMKSFKHYIEENADHDLVMQSQLFKDALNDPALGRGAAADLERALQRRELLRNIKIVKGKPITLKSSPRPGTRLVNPSDM